MMALLCIFFSFYILWQICQAMSMLLIVNMTSTQSKHKLMQTFTASQLLPENDMNRNGHSEVVQQYVTHYQ